MDPHLVKKFIRRQIYNGHSRQDVFAGTYCEFSAIKCKIAHKLVARWFEKRSHDSVNQIPPEFRTLIEGVRREFQLAKHVLDERTCLKGRGCRCDLEFISERYALEIRDGEACSIYLYDVFHERERKLQIEGEMPSDIHMYYNYLTVIDSDYFIYYRFICDEVSTKSTHFYLLNLKLSEFKCTVVDSIELNGMFKKCIIDSQDGHKFLFYMMVDGDAQFYRASLENSKLLIDENVLSFNPVGFEILRYFTDTVFMTGKLEGSKITGIKSQSAWPPNGRYSFTFNEMVLNSNEIQYRQIYDIGLDDRVATINEIDKVLWIKNECYSLCNQDDKTILVKFELNAQTGITVKELGNCGSDNRMFFESGTITICSTNEKTGQHIFQRVVLNGSGPDKLLHLALGAFREQAMFTNSSDYTELVKKLPLKLRPFEQ